MSDSEKAAIEPLWPPEQPVVGEPAAKAHQCLMAEIAIALGSDDREVQAEADALFIEQIAAHPMPLPQHVRAEAKRLLEEPTSAKIIPFARRHQPLPVETFMLLAAASVSRIQSLLSQSESGLWSLEVFVAQGAPEHGTLLLMVHVEHQPTYEGREATIIVDTPDGKRTLAQSVVTNGELYADISLEGLDLHTRDAISIVFGDTQDDA